MAKKRLLQKKEKQDLYLYFQACCKKKLYLQQFVFVFVFVGHLLQEKKQFVFQFGCKLVRGVGLGEAASSDKKKRQNN